MREEQSFRVVARSKSNILKYHERRIEVFEFWVLTSYTQHHGEKGALRENVNFTQKRNHCTTVPPSLLFSAPGQK